MLPMGWEVSHEIKKLMTDMRSELGLILANIPSGRPLGLSRPDTFERHTAHLIAQSQPYLRWLRREGGGGEEWQGGGRKKGGQEGKQRVRHMLSLCSSACNLRLTILLHCNIL